MALAPIQARHMPASALTSREMTSTLRYVVLKAGLQTGHLFTCRRLRCPRALSIACLSGDVGE